MLSTCISGGAHRITARCEYAVSGPAVYAALAPVAELSFQRLRASAPVVEYIAPAPAASWVHCTCSCSGCSTALCRRAARGPHTKTGRLQDTVSQFLGSYCHDTHVKTQCCGSHPCGPLLSDSRRLTVGPGTREDLVAATVPVVAYFVPVCSIYVASAFGVPGPVHYCVSACHGHCACGVWSRLAAEVLVSGSVHTHVARMTYLGSGFQHSGRLATSGRNASRCGKEAKRRTQLGTQPRLSSAPAVRLRRGVESTHRRSASPRAICSLRLFTSVGRHVVTHRLIVMPSAWVDRPPSVSIGVVLERDFPLGVTIASSMVRSSPRVTLLEQ